jgi:hypothetical protein
LAYLRLAETAAPAAYRMLARVAKGPLLAEDDVFAPRCGLFLKSVIKDEVFYIACS